MEEDQPTKFPRINVRTARKTINEKLMECVVQCLSEFKVSQNDVAGIIIHTANMEVTYLHLSVAPDIRQQRRVKDAGKFGTQKFSLTELYNSIKNAINPDESVQDNINELLLAALV